MKKWKYISNPEINQVCLAASGEEWIKVRVNGYDEEGFIYLCTITDNPAGDVCKIKLDNIQFRECE